jgi:hypothetical protein
MPAETVPELRPASEVAAELQGKSEAEPIADEDPKAQLEYTFPLEYKDPRGKLWTGEFRNRILSIRQKQQVKVLKARIGGGLPVEALDADVWTLNEAIAHMTFSLVKRPDWAKNLDELYDEQIVYKLYEEVASHEARFHRLESDTKEGEGAGG